MTTAQIIDAGMAHWLNKGQADVSDATFRARIEIHARRSAQRRWNARPWPFRMGSDSGVDIDTTGKGPLPARFASFGKDGLAIVISHQKQMRWMPPRDLIALQNTTTATSTSPDFYTVDGIEPNVFLPFIKVHPKPAATMSNNLFLYFSQSCPAIVDGVAGLEDFPVDMHESVLLKDVIAQIMIDEGDARSVEIQQEADRNERVFWAEYKQGRQQAYRQPRYGAGAYRW